MGNSGMGLPQNATDNWVQINGILASGETVTVTFPAGSAGQIPSNPPIGTQFSGYVWISYCTISGCAAPQYAKVATLNAKESGTGQGATGYQSAAGSGGTGGPGQIAILRYTTPPIPPS